MRGKLVTAGLVCLVLGFQAGAHEALVKTTEPAISDLLKDACEGMLTGKDLKEARAKWSGKVVIFDTNVLLNDPYAIYKYPGAEIVIPGTVLEELDGKKEDLQTGKAARTFSRLIDDFLREGGNLRKGVEVMPDTILKVDNRDLTSVLTDTTLERHKKDNEIVAMALSYTLEVPGHGNVVLVSDDRNVRIKAASEEVVALPFEYEWVTSADQIDHSYKDFTVSDEDLNSFLSKGELKKPADLKMAPNEFVMLRTENREGTPDTLARYVYDRENPSLSGLRKLRDFRDLPFRPMNLEQAMALELLLDPNIELVILEADAGTGKTFITMMAALEQKPGGKFPRYDEIMITKPMVHMGKTEMGALPGGKDDKLLEFFNSYYDNLRVLKNKANGGGDAKRQQGSKSKTVSVPNLELLAFPYVRGRSLHFTFLVVDEFQNTNILEAKTILTRASNGSKVVVLGNAAQIDVPYLNERNNGLSVTASLFTQDTLSEEERSLVGFAKLKESVRTDLARLAIKLFNQPLPQR